MIKYLINNAFFALRSFNWFNCSFDSPGEFAYLSMYDAPSHQALHLDKKLDRRLTHSRESKGNNENYHQPFKFHPNPTLFCPHTLYYLKSHPESLYQFLVASLPSRAPYNRSLDGSQFNPPCSRSCDCLYGVLSLG